MIDRRVTRLVWCFVSLRLLPSVRSSPHSRLRRVMIGEENENREQNKPEKY